MPVSPKIVTAAVTRLLPDVVLRRAAAQAAAAPAAGLQRELSEKLNRLALLRTSPATPMLRKYPTNQAILQSREAGPRIASMSRCALHAARLRYSANFAVSAIASKAATVSSISLVGMG
jgi:hypothetical protein